MLLSKRLLPLSLLPTMSQSSFMTATSTQNAAAPGLQPASPRVRDYAFRSSFQAVDIGTPFKRATSARPETPVGMSETGQPVSCFIGQIEREQLTAFKKGPLAVSLPGDPVPTYEASIRTPAGTPTPRYYGREVYEVWQQAQDKHKEAQGAQSASKKMSACRKLLLSCESIIIDPSITTWTIALSLRNSLLGAHEQLFGVRDAVCCGGMSR